MTAVCGQIKQGGPGYRYDGHGAPKTAWQMDEYILKGEGEEVYTPRFTFHGFRYVEVTGFPGKPTLDALEGLRLNSDVAPAGSFACSNERFNRIQQMVLWTELSNLFSVQSDCPHREKFGYGGDIVAASEMAMFNFDMARFYAKAVQDLADAVRPNGGFTETAPFVGIADEGLGEKSGPVGWGTAQPLSAVAALPVLRRPALARGAIRNRRSAGSRCCSRSAHGRHPGQRHQRPREPGAEAARVDGHRLSTTSTRSCLLNIARALGKEAEAAEAEALAGQIKAAFNRKFLQPGTGRYDTATQACQAFALYMGLVPPEEKERALEVLVRDIVETHKGHLSTGHLRHQVHAARADRIGPRGRGLSRSSTSAPSRAGATCWRTARPRSGSIGSSATTPTRTTTRCSARSANGSTRLLAGINPAPDAVGFDKIIIRPQPVGDLKWVKASYDSVRGKIVSEWSREAGNSSCACGFRSAQRQLCSFRRKTRHAITESGKPHRARQRGSVPAHGKWKRHPRARLWRVQLRLDNEVSRRRVVSF